MALFSENGPYIIDNKTLELSLNPYSWNKNASVMWIDQPVGTGYSYADTMADYARNETEIARQLVIFLTEFFALYTKYAKLPFFVYGESYAGHYVPATAARIVEYNQESPNAPILLAGIGIGNGWVNPAAQYPGYPQFAYANKLISDAQYQKFMKESAVCEKLIAAGQFTTAMDTCQLMMTRVMSAMSKTLGYTLNPYDIRIPCDVQPLCYNMSYVDAFLAKPDVIKALGVEGHTWSECDNKVHTLLIGDWITNLALDLPKVLAAKVNVLIYSGMEDFICNYVGGRDWVTSMDWAGASAIKNATYLNFNHNGKVMGYGIETKPANSGRFTFLEVIGAGHMVPMDQPSNSLYMLNYALSGQAFFPKN